jgi:hypothetical protein
MDWFQFIDGMTGHILSVPVVFLVLLFLLREHVGPLVARLLEVSVGGYKLTFSKEVATGAKILEHAPPLPDITEDVGLSIELDQGKTEDPEHPEPIELGRHTTRDSKWVQPNLQGKALWDTTAAGQIISGFEAVESLVREIGKTMGFEPANGVDERMIMGLLAAKKAVSDEMLELFNALNNGRNLIAHGQALASPNETLEYVRQAAYLLATLTNLKHRIDRGQVKL